MRSAFQKSSVISLIVIGSACSLAWATSYRTGAVLDWTWSARHGSTHESVRIVAAHGGIGLAKSDDTDADRLSEDPTGVTWHRFKAEQAAFLDYPQSIANRIGFGYDRVVNVAGGGYSETALAFPFWLIVCIVFAHPATVGLRRTFRRRRRDAGSCATCGYDIRFSQRRCPECGQPVGGHPAKA